MKPQPELLPALDARLFLPADAQPGQPIRLAASHCVACARNDFPQRERCAACCGPVQTVPLAAVARLGGYTAVLSSPPGALITAPYAVAIAVFPERVSVLGLLVGACLPELQIDSNLRTVAVAVGANVGYAFELIPRADEPAAISQTSQRTS